VVSTSNPTAAFSAFQTGQKTDNILKLAAAASPTIRHPMLFCLYRSKGAVKQSKRVVTVQYRISFPVMHPHKWSSGCWDTDTCDVLSHTCCTCSRGISVCYQSPTLLRDGFW
jgi:hypothetical protein